MLVCVGTVLVLGRGLLQNTLRARMAQFAVAYTLVFLGVPVRGDLRVVERVVLLQHDRCDRAFAMPAILDEIGRRCDRARWLVIAGVALAATGLIDLVIRSMGQSALNMFNT